MGSEAAIAGTEPGVLRLIGVLDYQTGPQLREAGRRLIRAAGETQLAIDCTEVERSSSVGISLLLAFVRDAAGVGKVVRIRNLTHDMRQIAQVSGVLDILPLEG